MPCHLGIGKINSAAMMNKKLDTEGSDAAPRIKSKIAAIHRAMFFSTPSRFVVFLLYENLKANENSSISSIITIFNSLNTLIIVFSLT